MDEDFRSNNALGDNGNRAPMWHRAGRNVEELPPLFAPPLGAEPPLLGAEPPPRDKALDKGPAAGKRRRRRRWKIGLGLAAALILITIAWLVITAPLSRALEPLADPAMLLVSADGKAFARRGAIKEAPVDIATLDPLTPSAFIAIEDRRFRHHWGIDPRAIARALVTDVRAGGVRQGGSTITQQLAKTSFLSSDRSIRRKAQEVIIAFWLEAWLTKDEILGRYLSSVYFGDGVYGLRAAARHYFDREPERLTLAQSAMLAGMVQAPSRLAPTRNLAGAQARSRLVLQQMANTRAITLARARATRSAVPVLRHDRLPAGTYFADWVAPAASSEFERDYGTVKVGTTLDSRLQRLAVRAVANARLGGAQAALVAMRPDGEVVAMVGGTSYAQSPFNRAVQARRQPGSAFKLFVYLAALRAGYTPDTLVDDRPVTIDGWTPANSDGVYRGAIPLREAFARSSNAATVRLAQGVGRGNVIRAARDLGIASPLDDKPSLALGTSGVSLIELTSAYAAVLGGRYPVITRGLPPAAEAAKSGIGSLFRHGGTLDPVRDRNPMLDLLWSAANQGTGRRAALPTATFGKTGTTQDNRDALFIGFAGDLVVGVWVGRDDNKSLGKVSGGTVPADIWRSFMAPALALDDRAGPAIPARYTRPPPLPSQSPLPEDWSDFTKGLNELVKAVGDMVEDDRSK